ncbi:MAG TPA: hypothetical protein VGB94_06045 [Acidobacteriaceae bacterium]
MRRNPKLLLATLLVFCAGLTACGGNPIAPVSSTGYNGLTGNWALAGERATNSFPLLSAVIFVNGTDVAALGNFMVPCSNAPSPLIGAVGGSMGLTGTLAADGTFTLTSLVLPVGPGYSPQITIKGSLPAAGSSTWNGTYSIIVTNSSSTCTANQSGSFTAQAIAPVSGTFAGTLPLVNGSSLSTASVSTHLVQGPASAPPGSSSTLTNAFPLSGTITIQGVSCFTHGTSIASFTNMIEGDHYGVEFAMDDGSTVLMTGWMTDFSGKQLKGVFGIIGGNCSGEFVDGTVTLQ